MAKKKSADTGATLVTYVASQRVHTQGRVTGNQYYLARGEEVKAPAGEFDHVSTIVVPKNGV